VPTWAGFLYLAVVLDVFSRRIVGWAMAEHLRTELVLAALDMALWNRRPDPGVIHHSDHGCQYTSVAFGSRCQEEGVVPSLGSRGDCFDNAITESFFATLECELLKRQTFPTHREARTAIFDYIEGFYNTHRRHSALGYLSPAGFERRLIVEQHDRAVVVAAVVWLPRAGVLLRGPAEDGQPASHRPRRPLRRLSTYPCPPGCIQENRRYTDRRLAIRYYLINRPRNRCNSSRNF